MGWKVEKYGARDDLYALVDPHGGVAITGTKEQMEIALEIALEKTQPSPKAADRMSELAASQTIASAVESFPDIGDVIFVPFWRSIMMAERDQGQWDVCYGTVVSVSQKKVCYALSNPSLPEDFGGVSPGPRSPLRIIDRNLACPDDNSARGMFASLKKPGA
jgi:hypothetical protein